MHDAYLEKLCTQYNDLLNISFQAQFYSSVLMNECNVMYVSKICFASMHAYANKHYKC